MEEKDISKRKLMEELESLQQRIRYLTECETRCKGIRQQIRHLASFPQLNPNPILELDSSGKITYCNSATSEILKALGHAGEGALFLPGDFGEILEALRKGKRGLYYREVAIGNLVFGDHIYLVPQLDTIRIYAYDISRYKEAQRALAESKENLRTILDNVHEAIFIHGLDGTILDVNKKMLEMYGVTREKALGLSIKDDYSAPGSPVEVLPLLWERIIAGESRLFEWKARRPRDGSTFDAEVFLRKITLRHRDVILAAVRDITERKNAEEMLRKAHDELEARVRERTAELAASNERLRSVLSSITDAYFSIDSRGRIAELNAAAERLFGHPAHRFLGKRIEEACPEAEGSELYRQCRAAMEERRPAHFEGLLPASGLWVEMHMYPGEGRFDVYFRDITGRKRDEAALRESERSKQLIMDSVPALIAYVDRDQRYRFVNRQYAAYHHRPALEILGRHIREVLGEARYHAIEEHLKAALKGEKVSYERAVSHEEKERYLQVEYVPHRGEDGSIVGIFAFMHDITETKRAEEFMRHQASHDLLTGLPNRALFLDHLTLELAQSHRTRRILAVLFLDLDRFKEVNDTLGHNAGDQLLREVAGRLKACLRESDTVARIGGDEFNILLTDIERVESVAVTVRKIISVFRKPFFIKGRNLSVTASIGVSLYPDDGSNAEVLIRNADTAMYHAKERGRNNYRFYNPDMSARDAERTLIEKDLRHMMERGEWVLYYQPQIEISTRRIISAEALLRWKHPERGLLVPAQFLPQTEETGLITPLGETVLRTACAQNRKWQDAGYPPLRITVNLSARQFRQPDIAETVEKILHDTCLSPEFLELEIAESAAMQSIEYTAETLNKLSATGVRVSLDDFGTGCSSLRNLKKLPLRKIKIDKTLIEELTRDPDYRTIVSAVITMAHSLSLDVAAEGVETDEQLSFLASSRCDEAQGYLFNRPLPPESFEQLLALHK